MKCYDCIKVIYGCPHGSKDATSDICSEFQFANENQQKQLAIDTWNKRYPGQEIPAEIANFRNQFERTDGSNATDCR